MSRKGAKKHPKGHPRLQVDVQVATDEDDLPTPRELVTWIRTVLAGHHLREAEVTVRIVGEAESAALNERYRHGRGATNVLAFPFEQRAELRLPLLGDIVICAPVVRRQAAEQGKAARAHWAHMVVHGTLHLLGHDHQTPDQTQCMESIEKALLAALSFPDPYAEI